MADAEEKEKKVAAGKKRVRGVSLVHCKGFFELLHTSANAKLNLFSYLVRAIEKAEREGQKAWQWDEEGRLPGGQRGRVCRGFNIREE